MVSGVASSLDFQNLPFPSTAALVTNLNTWATYYFTLNVENPPHWENNLPNVQEIIPLSAPPALYYVVVPVAVHVSGRGHAIAEEHIGL